jgi:hypothetical protein
LAAWPAPRSASPASARSRLICAGSCARSIFEGGDVVGVDLQRPPVRGRALLPPRGICGQQCGELPVGPQGEGGRGAGREPGQERDELAAVAAPAVQIGELGEGRDVRGALGAVARQVVPRGLEIPRLAGRARRRALEGDALVRRQRVGVLRRIERRPGVGEGLDEVALPVPEGGQAGASGGILVVPEHGLGHELAIQGFGFGPREGAGAVEQARRGAGLGLE